MRMVLTMFECDSILGEMMTGRRVYDVMKLKPPSGTTGLEN